MSQVKYDKSIYDKRSLLIMCQQKLLIQSIASPIFITLQMISNLRNQRKGGYTSLHTCDIRRKVCIGVFFNKVAGLKGCNFIKQRLQTQVFSSKYCEIVKNTFFYRTPPVDASVDKYLWRSSALVNPLSLRFTVILLMISNL